MMYASPQRVALSGQPGPSWWSQAQPGLKTASASHTDPRAGQHGRKLVASRQLRAVSKWGLGHWGHASLCQDPTIWRRPLAIAATGSCPAATPMTRSYTSSLEAVVASTPLRRRNTAVASQPRRLLPSTRGWFLTSDWSRAAALLQMSAYASCPKALAAGRAAADPSNPRSRIGGGSPSRRLASVMMSSMSRYSISPGSAAKAL